MNAHYMDLRVAYISSKKEDRKSRHFCNRSSYLPPQPLNPSNIYQKFEIRNRSSFVANSVASDGSPPEFLLGGWRLKTSTPKEFLLNEAPGLNTALRAQLPDFNFPSAKKCSAPVVVGKWYCPFMFIKEGSGPKDQMKCSTYYEVTLEQHWEQIFCCENMHKEGNVVPVDVLVECEGITIAGTTKAVCDQKEVADGVMLFRCFSKVEGARETTVGLRIEIVERMQWEQERVGWVRGQVRVKRTEEFDGIGMWRKFGCYMLVEKFSLKRMDGSLALTFDFRHTHQVRSKWELA